MNPIESLVRLIQDLTAYVPDVLLPVLVALAGMIPFVEGEISSFIGVWAGLHPVVAGLSAAAGNFASVLLVVLLGSRVRSAITARRARRAADWRGPANGDGQSDKPESKGRMRFQRFLVRYGVPGASLLGPLALPTQFTGATLVASGVRRGWVLLWQGIAIVAWTTLSTASATGLLALAT